MRKLEMSWHRCMLPRTQDAVDTHGVLARVSFPGGGLTSRRPDAWMPDIESSRTIPWHPSAVVFPF